jgi:hypothetical protein
MCENLEAKVRVLIENVQTARRLLAMTPHEIRVLQQPLEPVAYLFPAARTWIALEDRAAIGDELVKFVSHRQHS